MKDQSITQTDTDKPNAITNNKTRDLIQLESVIKNGIDTWVNVGNALLEIRDRKLYKIGHSTFKAYCQSKWNMQRAHAYRLMSGAEVVNEMSPTGDISESVARELTRAPESQREMLYALAEVDARGQVPTAKQVKAAISRYMIPKELEALSKYGKFIWILHRGTTSFAELAPATDGHWYLWWTENDADGTDCGISGIKNRTTLHGSWIHLQGPGEQIDWQEAEFRTVATSMVGHFEPGIPWKWNHAIFNLREEYLERGLGIRNRSKTNSRRETRKKNYSNEESN